MPVLCTTIFHCKIMYDVRDKKLSSRRFPSKYFFFPEQQEHKEEQLLVSTMWWCCHRGKKKKSWLRNTNPLSLVIYFWELEVSFSFSKGTNVGPCILATWTKYSWNKVRRNQGLCSSKLRGVYLSIACVMGHAVPFQHVRLEYQQGGFMVRSPLTCSCPWNKEVH